MTGPATRTGTLPKEVVERAKRISATPHLAHMADLLIGGAKLNTELVAMWRSVERASKARGNLQGDEWVLSFLGAVTWAAQAEPFVALPMRERRAKAKRIQQLAAKLAEELQGTGLDVHMVRPPKHSIWGWLYYEDLSDSNQRRCDADREPKLRASGLILGVAERASRLLETEHYAGRISEQSQAIRFCRRLAELNELAFGEGEKLYPVVAIAANALFPTSYSAGDVSNLMTR